MTQSNIFSNSQSIIFFSGIINKMSQLFSELNYLYLNAMLLKPPLNFTQLSKAIEKQIQQKNQKSSAQNQLNKLSQNEKQQIQLDQQQAEVKGKQKEKDQQKELRCILPKTPLSSFMIFYNEHRHEIKKNFPQCNSKEIKNLACNVWKDLNKEEKEVYYRLHKQQAIRYNRAMQSFRINMQSSSLQKRQFLQQKLNKRKEKKEKIKKFKQAAEKANILKPKT